MDDYVSSGELLADLSALIGRPPRRDEEGERVEAEFSDTLATEFAEFARLSATFELPPLLGMELDARYSVADVWGFSVEDVMDNEWSVEEDWALVWVTSRPFLHQDACYVAADDSGVYALTEDPYEIEWIAGDFGLFLRAAVLVTAAKRGTIELEPAAAALRAAEIETPFDRFGDFWDGDLVEALSNAGKKKKKPKKKTATKKKAATKKVKTVTKKKSKPKKKAATKKKAIELAFDDGKSSKFWEGWVEGADLVVRFGKTGTDGQTRRTSLTDATAAAAELEKRAAQKRKKGYG
ncbi:MAG: WGR domain-containing protein [Deltaproteobacteria bacterium]|nr:WGR domain-containing protein [Deltaproteobacteria bacterium]